MHAEALRVLEATTAAKRLRDPLGVREQRARLFLVLGRQADAEEAYRSLIATNPEHYGYHAGLQAALALPQAAAGGAAAPTSEEQRGRLAAVYAELQTEHPRSSAVRRMPLDFLVGTVRGAAGGLDGRCASRMCGDLARRGSMQEEEEGVMAHAAPRRPTSPPQEGDAFTAAADSYVRRYLLRGIPSLFSDLKPLYASSAKAALLGQLFERHAASLQASNALPPLAGGAAGGQEPAPQALVWCVGPRGCPWFCGLAAPCMRLCWRSRPLLTSCPPVQSPAAAAAGCCSTWRSTMTSWATRRTRCSWWTSV